MSGRISDTINESIGWQAVTIGGGITGGGTSAEFNTGEWRVDMPIFHEEKCTQCLLCTPVCPDSSIPVVNGKRGKFDLLHCKGCGICAKVCPFGAIEMKKGEE